MSQGMFCTWTHDNGAQLPERVQDYLGLLAESSTTGMMQVRAHGPTGLL